MNTQHVVNEIAVAVASLPTAARPYLLALVLAEQTLSPFLEDLLTTALTDAVDLMDEQHMALVAAHVSKRAGNTADAARYWAAIDYAGTADEARAACVFMAGLPRLIRSAEGHSEH